MPETALPLLNVFGFNNIIVGEDVSIPEELAYTTASQFVGFSVEP